MTTTARALLLDVEGTTTPVDFVYRVLFPYAHDHAEEFLARRFGEAEVAEDVKGLRELHAAETGAIPGLPAWTESPQGVAAYARWLMDQDRKVTPLKSLQGRMWEEGFSAGALLGQVYEDVPRAFPRWHAAGETVSIFSSGSILAQKLLFSRSSAGDLTPWIREYFDTTTGAKREPESYRRIASALHLDPARLLFVSDVPAELHAARAAGLGTTLMVREGRSPEGDAHRVVRSFDEIP